MKYRNTTNSPLSLRRPDGKGQVWFPAKGLSEDISDKDWKDLTETYPVLSWYAASGYIQPMGAEAAESLPPTPTGTTSPPWGGAKAAGGQPQEPKPEPKPTKKADKG